MQTIKRTLTNVTAMAVYLATCTELVGYVGWFTFGVKYIYYQYALAPARAALIFGESPFFIKTLKPPSHLIN